MAAVTPPPGPPAPAQTSPHAALRALADPHRWQLLELIRGSGGEACVCDLTASTDLSQPTVSHHLRALVEAGLLEREKRGVWAWYRAVPGPLLALREELLHLAEPAPGPRPGCCP